MACLCESDPMVIAEYKQNGFMAEDVGRGVNAFVATDSSNSKYMLVVTNTECTNIPFKIYDPIYVGYYRRDFSELAWEGDLNSSRELFKKLPEIFEEGRKNIK